MDRGRAEDRPDETDAQGDRAAIDELARDAHLLRGGGGVDRAQELHQLPLCPVGPEDEPEHAHDERE